jgi:TolA-binding protein
MALAYEAKGNTNEAKTIYIKIRDEYPRSIQARDMDKELARLGVLD